MTHDAKQNLVETGDVTGEPAASTLQIDWAEINARWEAQRAEAREQLQSERADLLVALKNLGVEEIEVCYDGYADEGNVREIRVSPAGLLIQDIEERLRDFVWGLAYNFHPGFENNDGGEGTVTWDVAEDRIDVDHADFYTARNTYVHEDI